MKKIFFVLGMSLLCFVSQAQEIKPRLHSYDRHKKLWLVTHPFIGMKCYRLTKHALNVSIEMKSDVYLDGDPNGGELDAFRHTYWMALLAQEVRWKKARRLGRAHEKDAYLMYKKRETEEGEIPDSIASEMDLYNNNIGLAVGCEHRNLSKIELIQLVKQQVWDGKLKVIAKNEKGEYLDCENQRIDMKIWKGKWGNPKCLRFTKPRIIPK